MTESSQISTSAVRFHIDADETEDVISVSPSCPDTSSDVGLSPPQVPRKRLGSARSSATCSDYTDYTDIDEEIDIAAPIEHVHQPSPYPDASWFSRVTWNWLNPLLELGSQKTLDERDMHAVMDHEDAGKRMKEIEDICKRLEEEQHAEADAAGVAPAADGSPAADQKGPKKKKSKLNLWLVLWHQFGKPYLMVNSLLFIYTGCKLIQPLMLNELVQFVQDPSEAEWHGYLYAIALAIGAIMQACVHHTFFFHASRVGINVRIALNGLIYSKALKLRTTHMMKTTTGQVINLVSNDSAKAEELGIYMPYLWNCPMECGIILALLYQEIGVAAFVGFAAILCLTPMQLFFSHLFGQYRRYTVQRTDLRVKTINEILIASDVMKMMNWESSLEEKVNSVRGEEFDSISRAARLKSINQAAFFASMSVVNLLCFFTMHFRGETFTPAKVFSTISYFNMIKLPLCNFIPFAVEKLTEANIAFKRIATFLELDDAVADEQGKYAKVFANVAATNAELAAQKEANPNQYRPGSIIMKRASFAWEMTEDMADPSIDLAAPATQPDSTSSSTPTAAAGGFDSRQGLKFLDVNIQPGQLVGIIGSIGSYKSSFLAACLGEMTQLHGGALVNGSIAYASQQAWIFAGTIRENIVFGRPFDAKRYAQTIRACQLVDDIKSCPAGDQTVIGERGASLSGGQRARVSCARAVYSNADVYLFDDPLAALDGIVARRLYQDVLGPAGLLAGKTRIIVTHQTHLLANAHIILLDSGRIKSQGSFDQLISEGHLKEEQRHAQQDNDSGIVEAQKKASRKAAREARKQKREAALLRKTSGAEGDPPGKVTTTALPPPVNLVPGSTDNNSILRAETSTTGALEWHVFSKMFEAGGGVILALGVIFLMVLGQACSIYADKWLSLWSGKDYENQMDHENAWVYLGLVCGTITLGVLRARAFFIFILRSALRLHSAMFHSVIYSPMRFFESNPIGRILNRFAKDQSIIDEMLPFTFFDFSQCFFMVIGCLVVVGMSTPYVLLIIVPIIPLFTWVRHRFLQTSRELKRLDATTRSPVYALFSSTLSGLMVIRSFKTEATFIQNFLSKMDDNSRCFIMFQTTARWFGLRLDAIASVVVLCLSLVIAGTRNSMSPSDAGFALSYCLQLTSLFQWAVRQSAEVETMMTSVERIVEYGELPSEGTLINPEYRPPAGWPATGEICFDDFKMRYRPGLDLVLKGVDVTIKPGEKVGVCGRTGAGKSSLFQAILRLVEAADGAIRIDGLEIGKLGLSDLRSNLAIIPQYPVIFSSTLRYNLDPFNRCTDDQLWSALDAVQLKSMVLGLRDGLLTMMAEFGGNFSVGETQLLCVARALLKPSKILLVDEATANVDAQTDELIQTVIREKFKDRTVLTIAHRLNTILDSEKIIVMSAGRVAEVGSPSELLSREPCDIVAQPDATYGLFAFMAKQKQAAAAQQ